MSLEEEELVVVCKQLARLEGAIESLRRDLNLKEEELVVVCRQLARLEGAIESLRRDLLSYN
jgi:DNA-binding FrmR family transcriptional regulator